MKSCMRMARVLFATVLISLGAAPGCHSPKRPLTPSSPIRTNASKDTSAARALTDQAYDAMQQNDLKSARELLDRAIALDSTFGPAQNNLGVVDYRGGRLYDAAWHFQNAINLMPQQPEPANNLGLVLEAAGKFADAEKQYDAASMMDLQNVDFAGNRARVRIRQGKTDNLTRQLLDYIVLYDPRAEWREWARATLTRLRPTE